jgi:hypothetical protein
MCKKTTGWSFSRIKRINFVMKKVGKIICEKDKGLTTKDL